MRQAKNRDRKSTEWRSYIGAPTLQPFRLCWIASKSLEQEHTANFLGAILLGKPVNAPLQAGIDASLPVQLALRSYWKQKTVSRSELS
jgi:hypothetical protein